MSEKAFTLSLFRYFSRGHFSTKFKFTLGSNIHSFSHSLAMTDPNSMKRDVALKTFAAASFISVTVRYLLKLSEEFRENSTVFPFSFSTFTPSPAQQLGRIILPTLHPITERRTREAAATKLSCFQFLNTAQYFTPFRSLQLEHSLEASLSLSLAR